MAEYSEQSTYARMLPNKVSLNTGCELNERPISATLLPFAVDTTMTVFAVLFLAGNSIL
jgi:hypothetical protein